MLDRARIVRDLKMSLLASGLKQSSQQALLVHLSPDLTYSYVRNLSCADTDAVTPEAVRSTQPSNC